MEMEDFLENQDSSEDDEYRRGFFNREDVRLRMELLLTEMWCLTPWEPQPCFCTYSVQYFLETYYLPSWWIHFPAKQRQDSEKLVYLAFVKFYYRGAFFVEGEWYAFNSEKNLTGKLSFLV